MNSRDRNNKLPYPIVIFDGVCNLCNHGIKFILRRDRTKLLRFAPWQWAVNQGLINKHHDISKSTDTVILIEKGKVYTHSSAIIRICGHLSYPWPLAILLLGIPPFLRNYLYNFVAVNRYKWFGRQNECMTSFPGCENRFLSHDKSI